MKKLISVALAVVLILSLVPAIALAEPDKPQGPHLYQLNIIGVPKEKSADMDNNNGHRIFVKLNGKSAIYLQEALDENEDPIPYDDPDAFAVLDANATGDKDNTAVFQMPKPGLDPYVVGDKGSADTDSDYSVFVRSLGKPGGWATITTCADLVDSTFASLLPGKFVSVLNKLDYFGGWASVEQVGSEITMRPKGKSDWTNVTAELLTIVFKVEVDISEEGDPPEIIIVYVRVPIFDDIIENEYWSYDNKGLKLLQVRFYDIETDVSENDKAPGGWNNE